MIGNAFDNTNGSFRLSSSRIAVRGVTDAGTVALLHGNAGITLARRTTCTRAAFDAGVPACAAIGAAGDLAAAGVVAVQRDVIARAIICAGHEAWVTINAIDRRAVARAAAVAFYVAAGVWGAGERLASAGVSEITERGDRAGVVHEHTSSASSASSANTRGASTFARASTYPSPSGGGAATPTAALAAAAGRAAFAQQGILFPVVVDEQAAGHHQQRGDRDRDRV